MPVAVHAVALAEGETLSTEDGAQDLLPFLPEFLDLMFKHPRLGRLAARVIFRRQPGNVFNAL